ncbi:LUD domain-containing protein [Fusobacterium perfoetens]|uniref:LUD domain-containing protein n=1 Tax=Fusobacterium perfoetens TaxID=852 RepID=UPI0015A4DF56|nr:LUD domain-containing protein [Fusobacterium perfoetens]MCF2625324.1 LUD domain-containing protein [Fusobacterium perfoetens]
MESNLRWYKEKNLDRLSSVLLDKGYLIHRVFSVKDAQEKILSLLDKEKTTALGDSWELMDKEFINRLREYNFYDRFKGESEKIKRESLTAHTAIIEGEYITENGQILIVGDYNTSSALFGAENLIVLVSENKIIKDVNTGFDKIKENEKYYQLRARRLNNINEGFSIGIIENGKKFEKRISVVMSVENTGL